MMTILKQVKHVYSYAESVRPEPEASAAKVSIRHGPVSIVIADERPIVVEGLRNILCSEDHRIVETCDCVDGAFAIVLAARPDILIIDANLPDQSAMVILDRLQELDVPTRAIVIAEQFDAPDLIGIKQLGCVGVLSPNASRADIIVCIRTVASGQSWVQPEIAKIAFERLLDVQDFPCALTPRQKEIVALVANGLRNKEIARELNITEGTVKMHLHHIFRRLGVNSRARLASIEGPRRG